MGRPTYTTREMCKTALDSKSTARDDAQVDRARLTANTLVDQLLHWAHLEPVLATRYFEWPNRQHAQPWELWFDGQGLIRLDSISSGGVTIDPADVLPEPVNEGPPYESIQLDLDTSAAFGGSTGRQRNIAIAGLWGGAPDAAGPAGALAGAVASTSATTVNVSDASAIGVGSLLRCGDERLIVAAKGWLDSAQNLGGNLTAQNNADLVNLSSGTAFHVGEEILVDSERMLLVDIAGNNGIVKRAWNGTTLAIHTAPVDIFVPRALTVERGACGTTAATHSDATALTIWLPPALTVSLATAEAQCQVLNEQAGYGRTVGAGDGEREAAGRALQSLRAQAKAAYGRNRTESL